jgi:DNA-binding LytR/AlgR family response regulator
MTNTSLHPTRILIVEDEFITIETLSTVLKEMNYQISGDAMSAKEAIDILEQGETDLAILDINIKGDFDGIWLANQIHTKYKIPFIFLTAFADDKTVKKAIENEPFGYLVKPFNKVDIFTAIEVAIKNFEKQQITSEVKDFSRVEDNSIFIRDDYMFVKLKIEDILFIKSDKNYLEIYTTEKRYVIRGKLSDFIENLNTSFIQIHRSYVINTAKVEQFNAGFVFVNTHKIPIGTNYKDTLKHYFKLF